MGVVFLHPMSDPVFSLEYEDTEVRQLLSDLQGRMGHLRPAMVDIGEEVLRVTDLGFEREVDPDGIPWLDLSPTTLRWKEENSRILKKLQSTGRLRASITYQATDDQVVAGTNVAYAYKHQLGIGVAQRQFLGIGNQLRLEIVQILQDYILEGEG